MTGTVNDDHTRFKGIIYPSDFDTDRTPKLTPDGSRMASRIVSDWSFDRMCLENIKERERRKRGKIEKCSVT